MAERNDGTNSLRVADWDDLWRRVKPMGKWQIITICICSLYFLINPNFTLLQAFIGASIEHHCDVSALENSSFSALERKQLSVPEGERCQYYDVDYSLVVSLPFEEARDEVARQLNGEPEAKLKSCERWHYNMSATAYNSSVEIDFELVCDRAILRPSIQSLVMLGAALGGIVSGAMSDRFGRRRAVNICVVLALPIGIAVAYSPNYITFIGLRFLHAIVSAIGIVCFTMVMEVVSTPRHRAIVGNVVWLPFGIGYMALPLWAYYMQEWRDLALFVHAYAGVLLLIYLFLFPESPRWLFANKRVKEGRRVLEQAARWNGRTLPSELDLKALAGAEEKGHKPGMIANVTKLASSPRLVFRTLLIAFMWFTNACIYFGLAFYAISIGGNIYLNFFFGGLVELPALVVSAFIYARFNRRLPLILVMLTCGACLLTIAWIDAQGMLEERRTVVTCLATAGKFFITVSFNMIFIYTAELYPTVVRAAGMSISMGFSRIGSISAPYIGFAAAQYWSPLAQLVFGALATAAGLSALLLPETRNCPMPQTIEEAELLGSTRRSKDTIRMTSTSSRKSGDTATSFLEN